VEENPSAAAPDQDPLRDQCGAYFVCKTGRNAASCIAGLNSDHDSALASSAVARLPLLLAARHADVFSIRITFGQLTADGVDGKRHDVLVVCWNGRSENKP
jgi:hypothetical protein